MKEEYDQAISDYNQAIKLNPQDSGAYNNRGLAYENTGQYDQAMKDYDKAEKLKRKIDK